MKVIIQGERLYPLRRKTEEEATRLRSEWVSEVSLMIRAVAQSLVPAHSPSAVKPDSRRILSGYLLYLFDYEEATLAVPYCELLVPTTCFAQLAQESAVCGLGLS